MSLSVYANTNIEEARMPAATPPPYDLAPLISSWGRSLTSRDLSENTRKVYLRAATSLRDFLLDYEPEPDAERPAPTELEGEHGIHREHIETHINRLLRAGTKALAHQHFRSLKTFFNWLVDEEEMDRSPMRTMRPPELGETIVPVIPDDALKRLMDTCRGKTFEDRRDKAILMMFLDTGGRLSEVTNRTQGKLDLGINVLYVIGKGDKERPLPFGRTTALSVDRYLRALPKHLGRAVRDDDPLWVGIKSKRALTIWGVGTMLKRRCVEAGLDPLHPHQFRHTFAHLWKLQAGNDDDLMRIMGWSSREMLNRYGASAGTERAREAHRRLSPGDNL